MFEIGDRVQSLCSTRGAPLASNGTVDRHHGGVIRVLWDKSQSCDWFFDDSSSLVRIQLSPEEEARRLDQKHREEHAMRYL